MTENKKTPQQEENLDMCISSNTLNFSVANFQEFNEKLNLARNQAEELQKTLNELRYFELKIELNLMNQKRD